MSGLKARMLHCSLLLLITLCAMVVSVSAEDWAPNFPVGSALVQISAVDQYGVSQNFEKLRGPSGLLLLFNRSTSW